MAELDDDKVQLTEAWQTASRNGLYHLSPRCKAPGKPLTSVGSVRVFTTQVCPKCWGARRGGQITAGRKAAAKKKQQK